MPRRDGTGATGKGPMTGTCSGSCTLHILDNRMNQSGVLLVRPDDRSQLAASRKEERRKFDMPGYDKTGPGGAGPMTGGMRGFCKGFGAPRTLNRPGNFGFMGRGGGGRGRRNRFFSTGLTGWQRGAGFGFGRGPREFADPGSPFDFEPELQLETLKSQAGYFEKVLEGIKRRIQKLESGTEENPQG